MFKSILVLLEEGCTEHMVQYALDFATFSNAKINLVYLMDNREEEGKTITDPITWSFTRSEAQAKLEQLVKKSTSQTYNVSSMVVSNQPIESLLQQMDVMNVDLIITAKPNSNTRNKLYDLMKSTAIPILHMPVSGSFKTSHQKILVPLDGSQRAECTLPLIQYLCKSTSNQLVLAHIVQPPAGIYSQDAGGDDLVEQVIRTGTERAGQYLQDYSSRIYAPTEIKVLVKTNIASGIHQIIDDEEIDLVVMSAHGESGDPKLPFGSIAHNLISYATVPVLVMQDLPNITKVDTTNALAGQRRKPGRTAV